MQEQSALVLALVRAHLIDSLDYMSWVPSYIKVRWSRTGGVCTAEHVGGHWRRKAHCKRSIDMLACVCKQPELSAPAHHMPLLGRKRRR